MKNAKTIFGGIALTALLLSSFSIEAKSNYSNKVVSAEDKIKARATNPFMPSLSVDEAPVFATQKTLSFVEKFSPEQLNTLIGVWPARTETVLTATQPVEEVVVSAQPEASGNYSPEQLVDILGISF